MALALPVAVWLCVTQTPLPPAGGRPRRGRRCADRRAGGGCARRGRRTAAVRADRRRRAIRVRSSRAGLLHGHRLAHRLHLRSPAGRRRRRRRNGTHDPACRRHRRVFQETVSVKPAAAHRRDRCRVAAGARIGGAAGSARRGSRRPDARDAGASGRGDRRRLSVSVLGARIRSSATSASCSTARATPLLLHTVRSTNDTGSIAMINSDVLDRASLMAGAHPQRQGDWLGATLDFGLREGSRDRVQVRGAASATTASIVLEGPLGRGRRGIWLTSIRKSYIDWLIRKIYPSIDGTLGFSDLQVKARLRSDASTAAAVRRHRGRCGVSERQRLAGQRHSSRGLEKRAWHPRRGDTRPGRGWSLQRVSFVGSRFQDLGLSGQELGRGYARSADLARRCQLVSLEDMDRRIRRQERMGASDAHRSETSSWSAASRGRAPLRRTDMQTDLASGWGQLTRRTATSGFSVGARVTTDTLSGRTIASPWVLGERTAGPLTFRASAGRLASIPRARDPAGTLRAAFRSAPR